MLEKYGVKSNDAILAEEKHMGLYEDLIQNHSAKLISGGVSQNTAREAQYMLLPNLVLYIGSIGRDKYADILQDACNKGFTENTMWMMSNPLVNAESSSPATTAA